MQESIVFLLLVQCRRKESSRSLSHLLMSFLFKTRISIPSHEHDWGWQRTSRRQLKSWNLSFTYLNTLMGEVRPGSVSNTELDRVDWPESAILSNICALLRVSSLFSVFYLINRINISHFNVYLIISLQLYWVNDRCVACLWHSTGGRYLVHSFIGRMDFLTFTSLLIINRQDYYIVDQGRLPYRTATKSTLICFHSM